MQASKCPVWVLTRVSLLLEVAIANNQSDSCTQQLPQPVALYLLSISSSFRPWQGPHYRAASVQQYAANTQHLNNFDCVAIQILPLTEFPGVVAACYPIATSAIDVTDLEQILIWLSLFVCFVLFGNLIVSGCFCSAALFCLAI